jgi:hypothetical protein
VILSSRPRVEERPVIRETIRTKTIDNEIRGQSSHNWDQAQENWFQECRQWKEDLRDKYSRVEASCGLMKCINNGRNYCYSDASAEVDYIHRW